MRMRPYVEAVPAFEFRRAEMIEKDEWPDRPARPVRQRPAHLKYVEVDAARHDHGLQGVAGVTIARRGVLARKKAHEFPRLADERRPSGAYLECREGDGGCQTPESRKSGKPNLQTRNAGGAGIRLVNVNEAAQAA